MSSFFILHQLGNRASICPLVNADPFSRRVERTNWQRQKRLIWRSLKNADGSARESRSPRQGSENHPCSTNNICMSCRNLVDDRTHLSSSAITCRMIIKTVSKALSAKTFSNAILRQHGISNSGLYDALLSTFLLHVRISTWY